MGEYYQFSLTEEECSVFTFLRQRELEAHVLCAGQALRNTFTLQCKVGDIDLGHIDIDPDSNHVNYIQGFGSAAITFLERFLQSKRHDDCLIEESSEVHGEDLNHFEPATEQMDDIQCEAHKEEAHLLDNAQSGASQPDHRLLDNVQPINQQLQDDNIPAGPNDENLWVKFQQNLPAYIKRVELVAFTNCLTFERELQLNARYPGARFTEPSLSDCSFSWSEEQIASPYGSWSSPSLIKNKSPIPGSLEIADPDWVKVTDEITNSTVVGVADSISDSIGLDAERWGKVQAIHKELLNTQQIKHVFGDQSATLKYYQTLIDTYIVLYRSKRIDLARIVLLRLQYTVINSKPILPSFGDVYQTLEYLPADAPLWKFFVQIHSHCEFGSGLNTALINGWCDHHQHAKNEEDMHAVKEKLDKLNRKIAKEGLDQEQRKSNNDKKDTLEFQALCSQVKAEMQGIFEKTSDNEHGSESMDAEDSITLCKQATSNLSIELAPRQPSKKRGNRAKEARTQLNTKGKGNKRK